MGQISIILIAGLIFLFSFEPPTNSGEIDQLLIIMFTIAVTVIPAILVYFFAAYYTTRAAPTNPADGVRRLYLAKQAAIGFEILILVGYVCDVYLLNLPVLIHQRLNFLNLTYTRHALAILPLIVGLMLIRLALYEIERGWQDRGRQRREFLSFHLKFLMLPLLPVFTYLLLLDLIELVPQVEQFFIKHTYLLVGLMAFLIFLTYIYAPLLLSFICRTLPLADTNLKAKIDRLAARDKIKYRNIVIWQTGSLEIANAAVAGIVRWSRQIFLTDALLHHFSDEEIETIVAHEFGHVRYKHMLIYFIFSLTYFLGYTTFYIYIGELLASLLPESPVLSSIGTILFIFFYFICVFRYLSRRFEHQADLYAVELTGNPEAFKSALNRLAHLNFLPQSIQRLFEIFHTHPSINRRIEFIDRLKAKDPRALRYQRDLLEVKILLALLPVLICILFFSDLSKLG